MKRRGAEEDGSGSSRQPERKAMNQVRDEAA
jgi:hypothetical protein